MKTCRVVLTALITVSTLSSCNTKRGQEDESALLKNSPIVAQQITNANGDTVIVCDMALLKDTIDFPLSAFLSDFELIKLEETEEALVKEDNSAIAVSPHYIGVYSGTGYKLFDKAGNYLTSLSAVGQGPNEYTISIYDSYIDEANDRVYLLPLNGDKILVYDLKGNVQPYIPLVHKTAKGKFRIDTDKNQLYVANMTFSPSATAFWIQDFKGNLIKEIPAGHLAIAHPDFSNDLVACMNMPSMDYSLFHWEAKTDTLYHYAEKDNRLVPSFTVKFGDKPLQHDYIELPDYYIVGLIGGEPDYRYTRALIDKHTLKGSYIRLKLDMLGDIDAPTWLQFDRGFYNANIYADYLQEQWENVTDTFTLPAGIAKLAQALKGSDGADLNNVVLIGKLKANSTEAFTMHDTDYKERPQVKDSVTEKKASLVKAGNPVEEADPDRVYGFKDMGNFSHIPLLKGNLDYFKKNNRYKDWDSKNPKKTTIGYIVEKNGKASNVTVKESSGNAELDQEAIRLIKEAEFTVGKLNNGKEVRAGDMVIVITFPTK